MIVCGDAVSCSDIHVDATVLHIISCDVMSHHVHVFIPQFYSSLLHRTLSRRIGYGWYQTQRSSIHMTCTHGTCITRAAHESSPHARTRCTDGRMMTSTTVDGMMETCTHAYRRISHVTCRVSHVACRCQHSVPISSRTRIRINSNRRQAISHGSISGMSRYVSWLARIQHVRWAWV